MKGRPSKSSATATPAGRNDIVYKAVRAFVKRIVVLYGNLHIDIVARPFAVDELRIQRCFAFVQIGDKLFAKRVITAPP